MPFTNHGLDHLISQELSKLSRCDAPEVTSTFPDLIVSLEDVLAEGEKVVVRWTQRGTHQGEMEELGPPTGSPFELEGITIHRFEGYKIAETWERCDNLSLL